MQPKTKYVVYNNYDSVKDIDINEDDYIDLINSRDH